MSGHRRAFFYVLAVASFVVAAGCGPSATGVGGPLPSPPVTIAASPSDIVFALNQTAPQNVTVTRSSGAFATLTAVAANPMLIGVTVTGISVNTATVSILPIAGNGNNPTSVTLTDPSGATTAVTVHPAACGRPPNLVGGTALISPAPGTAHVPTNVGTLYFTVFSPSPQFPTNVGIHLVVGGTQTLEGTSALVLATPPVGAPTPAPLPPGLYEYVAAGTVPTLPSGTTIQTQLYDDTCQPAAAAGTFTT